MDATNACQTRLKHTFCKTKYFANQKRTKQRPITESDDIEESKNPFPLPTAVRSRTRSTSEVCFMSASTRKKLNGCPNAQSDCHSIANGRQRFEQEIKGTACESGVIRATSVWACDVSAKAWTMFRNSASAITLQKLLDWFASKGWRSPMGGRLSTPSSCLRPSI